MARMGERGVGHLDEVLDNLGVFRAAAEELVLLCPSGFRRVPISQGSEFYFSIQALAPGQIAYAHTHPDSEEWTVVLSGTGEARIHGSVPLGPGSVLGRAAAYPHGFRAGPEPLYLLSIQAPRPTAAATPRWCAGSSARTAPSSSDPRRRRRAGGRLRISSGAGTLGRWPPSGSSRSRRPTPSSPRCASG